MPLSAPAAPYGDAGAPVRQEQAGRPWPAAPRNGVPVVDGWQRPAPTGPAPLGPALTGPAPTGHAAHSRAPAADAVPRFGAGSKAQRFPWLLPVRPAASGVAADEARLGDLAVRAASLVGPGHRCQEPATARQDAYRLARDATGDHLLLAVADGVSSSAHAELGATVAASTAVNHLRRRLDEPHGAARLSAAELFEETATAMRREAARRGLDPSDVCAVLFTAVIPTRPSTPTGARTMWAAWLGDASLWRLDQDRWRYAAGDRKSTSGGYDSNAVQDTLPADPHAVRETLLDLRPGDVVSLVSDGVGDGLATIEELNAYLADRWRTPLPVAAYLSDVGFDAERFLDDRTSVTVWVDPDARSRPPGRGIAPASERFGGPGGWPA
ncbi:protein phosphatase 2C domain-containing protein [Streptomyces luteolifulvus]|uniref:protein phosphatase 2C domain-containing protein n=1 Tax=Streptomyces luteolifulvus TaxID=2615112 RepID=UPI001784A5A9|nr:protein phosphatase 2C domain-containing protein [Streptomyces luteolifulvus]